MRIQPLADYGVPAPTKLNSYRTTSVLALGSLAKLPVNGSVWTANLNRWDEPDRRLRIWSDPLQKTPNPHAPARFGQLVFVR
jgi:hypothetical protein